MVDSRSTFLREVMEEVEEWKDGFENSATDEATKRDPTAFLRLEKGSLKEGMESATRVG